MCPTFMTKRKHGTNPFISSTYEIGRCSASPVDKLADLAAAEIERGDFEAADSLLREGLAQDPGHAECQAYLAISLAALGRSDGSAEESARSVIRNHPDNPVGWFALGQVHLLAGRRGAAFQHFAQARDMSARNRGVRQQLNRSDPRQLAVFPNLPRNHFLNMVCGRIRTVLIRMSSGRQE